MTTLIDNFPKDFDDEKRYPNPRLVGSGVIELATLREKTSPYRVDMLPKELLGELYADIVAQRSEQSKGGDLAMIRLESGSKFGDIARYIEASIFKSEWYSDQNAEEFAHEMEVEYGPYEDDSKFIISLDIENLDENGLPRLAGMARVVGGKKELLKTLHDTPEVWGVSEEEIIEDLLYCESEKCKDVPYLGDPSHTWDYSSMAVGEDYRNGFAYPILSHELYKWSLQNNVTTVTTILVEKFFKLYQFRGVPFRPIAGLEPRIHMGELSRPVVMHIPEVPEMLTNEKNTRARQGYLQMADGDGLAEYSSHYFN